MNGLEKINQRIRRDGSDEVAAIRAEAEGRGLRRGLEG